GGAGRPHDRAGPFGDRDHPAVRQGHQKEAVLAGQRPGRDRLLVPATRLVARPRAAERAVERLDVPQAPPDLSGRIALPVRPALAIFEPGSACGTPCAPLLGLETFFSFYTWKLQS